MAVTPLITHANQVRDEDQVYCDRELVLQLLAGVNKGTIAADDTADPLANLGAVDVRDAFIDLWMSVAAEKVNAEAKQDYGYHKDITFYVSGTNTDRLDLKDLGIPAKRIVSVANLVIDDTDIDDDSYYVDGDSWLYYAGADYTASYPPRPNTVAFFSQGLKNIHFDVTWGYTSVPQQIRLASALFVCSYILPFAEAFDSNAEDDTPGGEISVQMGDMRVTQKAQASRYSTFAKHCHKLAQSLCQTRAPRVRARGVEPELAP